MAIRKNEKFTLDIMALGGSHDKTGAVEYIMPRLMADELLNTRKGQDKNMDPQNFLVKVVNEDFGLLYNCTQVTIH